MNDSTTFDTTAKTLHWLMAILIISSLVFGTLMENLPKDEKAARLVFHSGSGILILLLAFTRIYWRRRHLPPELPSTMKLRDQKLAEWNTRILYFLIVFQPSVGILHGATYMDFDVRPFDLFNLTALLPSSESLTKVFHVMHSVGSKLLILSVVIHIGASFKHLLIDKDRVFQRMFPFMRGD